MSKFRVHVGASTLGFDTISEAQTVGENYSYAMIRKNYGEGEFENWQNVCVWDGRRWTYYHRKPTKKAAKKRKR